MVNISLLSLIASFLSVLLTVTAALLFRIYLRKKKERAVANATNRKIKLTPKIVNAFTLLSRGRISLEGVVGYLNNYSVLKKLEKASTRGEMIGILYREVGLKVPKGFKLNKKKLEREEKREIIKRVVQEKLKKRNIHIFPRGMNLGKVRNSADLIAVIGGFDDDIIAAVLRSYRRQNKMVKEQLVRDAGIREILSKSRTKEEVISLTKQSVGRELTVRYREIKARITALRKKGMDMGMADLNIMAVPAKIKMFELTGEREHVKKAEDLLGDIEMELGKMDGNKS